MRVRVTIGTFALMISTFISDAREFNCTDIQDLYSPSKQELAIKENFTSTLVLYWGSDTAHAVSALFAIVLRNALGYQNVQLKRVSRRPYHLEQLIALPKLRPIANLTEWAQYKQVALALSMPWDPKSTRKPLWIENLEYKSGLAGYRLEEFGASSVPVRHQLYVYLASNFRYQEHCAYISRRIFYSNASALIQCGFNVNNNVSNYDRVNVIVYGLSLYQSILIEALAHRDETSSLRLRFEKLPARKNLHQMLRTDEHSVLFVDYDIWSGYPNVNVVLLPPCIPVVDSTCQQELDTGIPMRVGEVSVLENYAPQLLKLAHYFTLTSESIREILLMANGEDEKKIMHAACKWAVDHNTVVNRWVRIHNVQNYEILIFHCADDPDFVEYDKLVKRKLSYEVQQQTMSANFSITLTLHGANCSDANNLKDMLVEHVMVEGKEIGVIIGEVEGLPIAIDAIAGYQVPVVLYNANAINVDSTATVWLTAGRSLHLALAINHFILSMSWRRVAVISEDSSNAKNLIDDLRHFGGFELHDYVVPLNLSPFEAEKSLRELKAANAHTILVNANAEDAVTILSAAEMIGMTDPENFAWIVREWRPNNVTINITHFTISFHCRSGSDVSETEGKLDLRKKMYELWPERMWPIQATAMADAVLSFVKAFKSVILKYPQIRDNTRNDIVIEALERSFIEEPAEGVIQNLTFKGHSLEETVVFVDEWNGDQRTHLARWRINVTAHTVRVEHEQRSAYPGRAPPYSAAWRCFASPGDRTPPTCYDGIFAATLLILVLIPVVIVLIHSARHCLFKKHESDKIMIQMLTRYEQKIKSALEGYLVNRSSLILNQKVGVGRFSCMHFAVLRIQGRPARAVLTKAFWNDHEENRMLPESCILAALDHDRIIRLVGVCIDNEPQLMLMEYAFFGDLLQYLRARRYLADGAGSVVQADNCNHCEESAHVSAEALTQLAHQAASALAYLTMRGVIHRDLSASNCLVDANRTLKLGGFGKAKLVTDVGSNTGNTFEKLTLITIQGLAPESLHGDFSFASDIWAFGIFVFELVTLGACPYGDMTPLCVEQFVTSGGNPQLPLDASPSTNDLMKLCWRRKPEERVTAAEVLTYLEKHPNGLQPALGLERNREKEN